MSWFIDNSYDYVIQIPHKHLYFHIVIRDAASVIANGWQYSSKSIIDVTQDLRITSLGSIDMRLEDEIDRFLVQELTVTFADYEGILFGLLIGFFSSIEQTVIIKIGRSNAIQGTNSVIFLGGSMRETINFTKDRLLSVTFSSLICNLKEKAVNDSNYELVAGQIYTQEYIGHINLNSFLQTELAKLSIDLVDNTTLNYLGGMFPDPDLPFESGNLYKNYYQYDNFNIYLYLNSKWNVRRHLMNTADICWAKFTNNPFINFTEFVYDDINSIDIEQGQQHNLLLDIESLKADFPNLSLFERVRQSLKGTGIVGVFENGKFSVNNWDWNLEHASPITPDIVLDYSYNSSGKKFKKLVIKYGVNESDVKEVGATNIDDYIYNFDISKRYVKMRKFIYTRKIISTVSENTIYKLDNISWIVNDFIESTISNDYLGNPISTSRLFLANGVYSIKNFYASLCYNMFLSPFADVILSLKIKGYWKFKNNLVSLSNKAGLVNYFVMKGLSYDILTDTSAIDLMPTAMNWSMF